MADYVLMADNGTCLVMGQPAMLKCGGSIHYSYVIYAPCEEINIPLDLTHVEIDMKMPELIVELLQP